MSSNRLAANEISSSHLSSSFSGVVGLYCLRGKKNLCVSTQVFLYSNELFDIDIYFDIFDDCGGNVLIKEQIVRHRLNLSRS